MEPSGSGGGGGGGSGGGGSGGGTKDEDAKNIFDRIGKKVYEEKVKNDEAKKYIDELKGKLSLATFPSEELASSNDTCQLVKEYISNSGGKGKRYPCGTRKEEVKRFSDTQGAQCDKKIEGNDRKNGDACAPFRRLNLCNKNMVKMDTNNDGKAKHKLLAEVCYAAKEEGDLIKTHYTPYQQKYVNPDSTICTVLARSFADIGDIVRGKDLYSGNSKEKDRRDKLENKLKEYFEKIYKDVTSSGRNGAEARYNDRKGDFFKLREDWWTANRHTVWKALTCSKELDNSSYFHATCNGKERTKGYCRCNGDQPGKDNPNTDPPTYFDYVPQFLRWFEEWAEDFCRKRKHKLQNAKNKCRGKNGTERYCDLNGCDCTKTKRGRNIYRWDHKCTGCFLSCSHFRTWIDNQKLEFLKQKEQFLKQKKKYETEISGGKSRKKRSSTTNNYKGYDEEFYEKLKDTYGDVDKFLDLLSKETACKQQPYDERGTIDISFNKNKSETRDIFSPTEYCQACPWCGVKLVDDKWKEKEKSTEKCDGKILYKPIDKEKGTPINFLYSGDEEKEIAKNLKAFCLTQSGSVAGAGGVASGDKNCGSDSQKLCQEWKCYQIGELTQEGQKGVDDEDYLEYNQEVIDAGGLCILENPKKNKEKSDPNPQKEPEQLQKTFNPFFYYWVAHMLKDSIHWRTEKIKGCLENGKAIKCTDKCKGDCGCFEKWVRKKKDEWKNIKIHFRNQEAFKEEGENGGSGMLRDPLKSPDFVLDGVLEKDVLLESIQDVHANAKDIERIGNMLEQAGVLGFLGGGEHNTKIDKFLQEEERFAKDCQQKQEKCKEQKQQERGGGAGARSDEPRAPTESASEDAATVEEDEEEEEEEEEEKDTESEEKEEKKEPAKKSSTTDQEVATKEVEETKEAEGPTAPTDHKLNVCDIVGGILTKDNLEAACKLKYNGKYYGWRCVPTSGDKAATGKSDSEKGSICVPPRRRRLYIQKLPDAEFNEKSLRKWFIESAAIETFFLWHRYIEDKKREEKERKERKTELVASETSEDTEQKQLETGDIPEEFKRQMFYTIADYRDIVVHGGGDVNSGNDVTSRSNDNKNILFEAGGTDEKDKQKMKQLQQKIDTILKQSGTSGPSSGPQNSGKDPGQTPDKWWDTNAQHIWHGMIYALTYNTDTASGTALQQIDDLKDKLWDSGKKQPKKEEYQYQTAKLKEEASGANPQTTQAPGISDNTPTHLSEFVKRPAYFRWLEEWGEEFCRKRTHKLDIIKKDCRGRDGNNKVCSGDGENCETIRTQDYDTISYFDCPSCGKSCGLYKRWIVRKKEEFDKQKDRYQKENKGAESTDHDNGFSTRLKTCNTAAAFLQKLGSCKKDNASGEDNKGKGYIDFNNEGEAFGHENYCDPCSEFKVKCKGNANCKGGINDKCDRKTFNAEDIIKNKEPSIQEVVMLVSDNSKSGNGFNYLPECADAGIFKGIKKDVWKCGEYCGVDVCKAENINGEGNEKQIIQIRALLKRWVEYFIQDYNKIKEKLKPCIENGEKPKCENKCEQKCKCVDKWIDEKRTEWQEIKKRYVKQYNGGGTEKKTLVKNFLEDLQSQIDFKSAIKPCADLTQFERSIHCNGAANSGNSDKDVIDCMLNKLENLKKKIGECTSQPSGDNQANGENQAQCDSTPLEDDEETMEEENQTPHEAQKMMPKICEGVIKPEAEEKGGCAPAPPEPPADSPPASPEPETVPERAPAGDQKEPAPTTPKKPPSQPTTPPTQLLDDPLLKTALMSSTIMWSIGIGFATFTYFYLKVLYICGCGCICICGVCLDIYVCICMCFIYILYIYIYIDKEKNEKNEKKKNEI